MRPVSNAACARIVVEGTGAQSGEDGARKYATYSSVTAVGRRV
jgi:hypothetical protein